MAETKTRGAWLYRRWAGLELGRPDGAARGVARAHFHDEVQIAVVTRGCRSFEVAGDPVDVPAGAMLVVPARVAHRDRGAAEWAGFNLYLPTSAIGMAAQDVVVVGLPQWLTRGAPDRAIDASGLLAHAMANGRICLHQPARSAPVSGTGPARSTAWHIRRTKRVTGITPYAAEVTARANRARRMLCDGHAPADVAAALGFADQAHLTRQFRLCFGTTPAAYRRAWSSGIPTAPHLPSLSFKTEGLRSVHPSAPKGGSAWTCRSCSCSSPRACSGVAPTPLPGAGRSSPSRR